ncbi:guanylate cyclase, putative [Bodo saltans]|uniref:adenylate cyclase n=1 Tax=Bodo saltans TaxID=75058 RepID=A0A0S4J5I7_BODSA|nr:guanylate cyclase, putative [Bodo saltans]|eukprot:CUG82335.1 guanylate cyclase, putative [Bodo saltans]
MESAASAAVPGMLQCSQLPMAGSGGAAQQGSQMDFRRANVKALLSVPIKSLRLSVDNFSTTSGGAALADKYLRGSSEKPYTLWFTSSKLEVAFAVFAISDRTGAFIISLITSVVLIGFVVIAHLSKLVTSQLTSGLLICGVAMFFVFTSLMFFFWRDEEADRAALHRMMETLSVDHDDLHIDDPSSVSNDSDFGVDAKLFSDYKKIIVKLEITMCGLILSLYVIFAGFTVGKGVTECSDFSDPTSCSRYIFLDGGIVAMFVLPLAIYPVRYFTCAVMTTVGTILYVAVRELPTIREQTSIEFRYVSIMWYVILGTISIVTKRLSERELRAHFREECLLGKQKERSRRLESYYSSIAASMIPASVARRIARGELFREKLEQAVVCVVGIRGFSRLATEWSSGEVVLMLQHVNVNLDGLLKRLSGPGNPPTALKVHAFGDEYVVVIHQYVQTLQRQRQTDASSQGGQLRRKTPMMSTSRRSSIDLRQGISGASGESEVEQSRSRRSVASVSSGGSDAVVMDTLQTFCYGVARISRDLENSCRCLSNTPVSLDMAIECGPLHLTTFGTQKNFLAVGRTVNRCRDTRRHLEFTPFLRPHLGEQQSHMRRTPHTIIAAADAVWSSLAVKWSNRTDHRSCNGDFMDLDENANSAWTTIRTTALLVASRTVLPQDVPQNLFLSEAAAGSTGGAATSDNTNDAAAAHYYSSPAAQSARLSWGGAAASRHDSSSVVVNTVFLETPVAPTAGIAATDSSGNSANNVRNTIVTQSKTNMSNNHPTQRTNSLSVEHVRNPLIAPNTPAAVNTHNDNNNFLVPPQMQDLPMDPMTASNNDDDSFSAVGRSVPAAAVPSLALALTDSAEDFDVQDELRRRWSWIPLYEFAREELETQFRQRTSSQNPLHRLILILIATCVVFIGVIISNFVFTGPAAGVDTALYLACVGLGASLIGLAISVVVGVIMKVFTTISPTAFLIIELMLTSLFIVTVVFARNTLTLLGKGSPMWLGIVVLLSMVRDHNNISVPQFWLFDITVGSVFVWLAYVTHHDSIQVGMIAMVGLFVILECISRGLFDRALRHRFLTAELSRRMQEQLLKDGESLEDLLRHMVPNETFAQLFRRTRIAASPLTAMVLNLRGVLPRGTLFSTKAEAMSLLQLVFSPRKSGGEQCGSPSWWKACDTGLSMTDRALKVVKESCIIKTSGDLALIVDDSSHDATTQAMVLLQLVTYISHFCRSEHPDIVVRGALTNGTVVGAVLGIAALSFEFHGEAVTVGTALLREAPTDCLVVATTRFVELLQWNSLFGESSSSRLTIRAAALMDDIHKGFDLTAQFDEPPPLAPAAPVVSTAVSASLSILPPLLTAELALQQQQAQATQSPLLLDENGEVNIISAMMCQPPAAVQLRRTRLVRIIVQCVQLWRLRGIQAKVPCHIISLEDAS